MSSVSNAQTFSGPGAGTSSDPYIITSGSELREVDNFLNDSSVYFELGSNIDLSGYSNWDPIGDDSNIFTGQFNGNGYTITGLQINHTTPDTDPFPSQYTGLFARSEGTIENITLASVTITGQYNVGGLVGDTEGNISNVFVSGTVNGEHNVGGIAGMNLGTIQSTSSSADVEVPNSGGNAGGLVGRTGEAGWPGVTILQSHATGEVVGGQNSGGLIGLLYNASVTQSYATGNVTGGFTAGGLVGISMDGNISESFATGDVNGAYDVGGLVGINEGSVSQSYAVGDVTATQPGVGGLVGTNESSGTVTESYSIGFVDGNENKGERGGFIGDNNASSSAITTSFWDTNSSGYTSSAGGTGKTTAEMTSSSTFSSWDSAVWDWPTGHYPKLQAIGYDDSFDIAAPSAPAANISGGVYNTDQMIMLSGESGASIYYTLDGTTPTTASTSYSSSITISATTTLKAIAVDAAGNVSTVLTETYTIDKTAPPAPTASTSGGLYSSDQTISLSGESGTSIYYTLDGSTPTTASISYSSSITISATTTLKAIAVDAAGNVSTVLTETYTIDKTAPPAPTANISGGSYNADQTITLSGESGASIYYTLDGSTPTTASTSYSSSITISSTTTLKAIAVDAAGNVSTALTETYTIDKTAPLIASLDGDNASLKPGDSPVMVDQNGDATITDSDSPNFDGGLLEIVDKNTNNTAQGNFSLDGNNATSGGDGTIAAGETIAVGGTSIGTVHASNDGQGGNTLTINFSTADATPARVQILIQNIKWATSSGGGNQTFTLGLTDPAGNNSTPSQFTMYPLNPDANNILYVDKNVSGGDDSGSSWANAVQELADALKWARMQDDAGSGWTESNPLQIWVADGTYKPLYHADDNEYTTTNGYRRNSFVMVPNVQLYGGFSGNETARDQRNLSANKTILSGELQDDSTLDNNAFHVVIATGEVHSATLDGFKVTKGYAYTTSYGFDKFTVNGYSGQNRQAGGMFLIETNLIVKNSSFSHHTGYAASVLRFVNSNPVFINTVFHHNTSADLYGGLVTGSSGYNLTLINTTVTNNEVNSFLVHSSPSVTIRNSILWNNVLNYTTIEESLENATVSHSVVQDYTGGTNNIDTDPAFVDPGNEDYSLQETSPAINSGNNAHYEAADGNSSNNSLSSDTDLAGSPRVYGPPATYNIDMGAYEFQSSINQPPTFVSTPDTTSRAGQSYHYAIEASDPDGDALTITIIQKPTWSTFTDHGDGTGTLEGTPGFDASGDYAVALEVSDGEFTGTQEFTITVADSNRAPNITTEPVTEAREGEAYAYTIEASDADGDVLAITAEDMPDWASFTDHGDGTATLEGTPGGADVGTHPVELQVSDGSLLATQQYTLTVERANRQPSITSNPVQLVRMGKPYNYTLEAEDPDSSNSIAFSATLSSGGDLPGWLSFTDNGDNTATFSGTPGEEDIGSYTIEVVAIDDGTPRQQSSQEFTLQVKYKEVTELKALYNYPNPFRNETKIKFELPEEDQVYLQIYNTTGSLVRQTDPRTFQPGANEFDFHAYNLTSGIYIYRIVSSNEVTTGRLVLTR